MPAPKKSDTDVRFAVTSEVEIREAENGGDRYAEGMGVVYDRETEIWPGFKETIARGAFEGTLRSSDTIKSFFNHNPSYVLSTTRSKPRLQLIEETNGLRYRSPIPDTSYGNDLAENLRRKNVNGSSFAFRVLDDGQEITYDDDGTVHRRVTKAELYEIGPVTNPAYTASTSNLRSPENLYQELRELKAARDAEEAKRAANDDKKRENELNLLKRKIDTI